MNKGYGNVILQLKQFIVLNITIMRINNINKLSIRCKKIKRKSLDL